MQVHEIEALAKIFVALGVNKIRLTGGEPLVRKDAGAIIEKLALLPVSLSLTTNAVRLHHFMPQIIEAGIRSLNISLDTLDANRFMLITGRDEFRQVWSNIEGALDAGLHVKINVVVMKGINDKEINHFINWTKDTGVHIRFIEFMPFAGNQWHNEKVVTFKEILETVESRYSFIKLKDEMNDTTKKYIVPGHAGTFSVISTMSVPFCATCNRIRLTADGKIKNCLFSNNETDLLTPLRNGADVEQLIIQSIATKARSQGGQFTEDYKSTDANTIRNRSMISIGG
jgi:cyclic pyranopterin phosphate synthase